MAQRPLIIDAAHIARLTLRFTDGVSIDIDGPYRAHQEFDGFYVVGNGACIPVDSRAEADELVRVLSEAREAIHG